MEKRTRRKDELVSDYLRITLMIILTVKSPSASVLMLLV